MVAAFREPVTQTDPASTLTDNDIAYTTRSSRGNGGRNGPETKAARPEHRPDIAPTKIEGSELCRCLETPHHAQPRVVLNNLYKHTQLQDTFGCNMLALVDGVPRTLSLDLFITVGPVGLEPTTRGLWQESAHRLSSISEPTHDLRIRHARLRTRARASSLPSVDLS
ncbi:hypothetical protein AB0H36_08175 [Kribbella sp. NPDC050820]|uniref:hypothetical protein n=1 Tax=Kribbella sp. NPDC050820 TaxID=3155408 RepID=UPI0033EF9578